MPFSPYVSDETLAERGGAAAAVRTAVLALFARLGSKADEAPDAIHGELAPARRRDAAAQALRARARAAYGEVEGAGEPALDFAFDVFASEIGRLEARLSHQSEALKAIRLYAPEPWLRRLSEEALAGPKRGPVTPPDFLVGNDLDEAEIRSLATRHVG